MKHINLVRTLPVGAALAGAIYFIGSEVSGGSKGGIAAGVLGVIVSGIFYIQIRLGHLSWFEKKDGKAHGIIIWIESAFPWMRAPPK
jgi:hypothetical protein